MADRRQVAAGVPIHLDATPRPADDDPTAEFIDRLGGQPARHADPGVARYAVAETVLHGPHGILQGGLASGLLLSAARGADQFGAPATSVDARLRAPTPLGRPVRTIVRRVAGATYDVVTDHEGTRLVEGRVELAGHHTRPEVADLLHLATVDLPEPWPQDAFPDCWVCGSRNVDGLRLLPGPVGDGQVVTPWVPDWRFDTGDGTVDPLVVAAVLDCPTVWASWDHVTAHGGAGAMLAGFHVFYFRDVPVTEPLRTVGRFDHGDGRKIQARSAVLDEDGTVYAMASAFMIVVPEVPTLPVGV